jgi:hypothetical protein
MPLSIFNHLLHLVFTTFNIVTVIYHTCAIGRGFRRLMCFATFNIVLVIYRTCAIGRGVQDAHVYCHFFNNVSVLYHIKHETPEYIDYSTGVVND